MEFTDDNNMIMSSFLQKVDTLQYDNTQKQNFTDFPEIYRTFLIEKQFCNQIHGFHPRYDMIFVGGGGIYQV
jgi:hypothetical protein